MARGTEGVHSTTLLVSVTLAVLGAVRAQVPGNEITGFSLSPPYFNLAEGARISATATCGEDETERPRSDLYCKLVGGPTTGLPSQTIQGQFCDQCNSNDPNTAHPASNAIDGTERWWQSPPLSRGLNYNEVNITLDLGQLFHVAYILIKFANSPRPDLWVLERSLDYGRTYVPWQYFAHLKRDCIEVFGKQPNARIVQDDDQICTTEYSRIVPLENGEIVVSLVNGRPGSRNFTYSPVLRDFTKATNIRLRFMRTNTLLGHLISKAQRDPTVTRRYYYSIKDISIGGRCMCHGHAQVCGARNPYNPNRLQCDCQHNTCGESCDRCCPGFNQKPWRAATTDSANECQPCQCHSHATDCYYDPEVERRGASLNIYGQYDGGGVCINCQHNTAGVNCERCAPGFYRPHGVRPESPYACTPCRCDPRTTAGCEDGSGRCFCRPNFSGDNCDRCADGYYGFPQCIAYPAPVTSTTKSPAGDIKDPDTCPAGYFGPPNCQPCQCGGPGVADWVCDGRTGNCRCRPGFQGRFCDRCTPGNFNYPNCQGCPCHPEGTLREVCDASGRCLCRPEVEGPQCDRCRPGYHSFPNCQVCRCDGVGVADRVCGPGGECKCHSNYAGRQCERCATGYYGYPNCAACQCSREGSYDVSCDPASGQCQCRPGVSGQRCDQCTQGGRFPQCGVPESQCNPVGTDLRRVDPNSGFCPCLPDVEGPLCDRCKPLFWNLSPENPNGCTECLCDGKGTLSGVGECKQENGECYCKPNTCDHTCNTCKEGYYLLQKKNYFGCQGCQCDVGGAVSPGCSEPSGQCQCRKHVEGRTCTQPETNFYFPDLHHMKYEVEDGITPNGRPVRFGYDPKEFPDFSWRGYATMSPAQSEVRVTVHVDERKHSLFRVVLRFANPSGETVTGRVTASLVRGAEGPGQSKEVVFPPTATPAFLTVPGNGFVEAFPLVPGKWAIHIRAEGVLLDYLVLLPSSYYEAPILQDKITEACSYLSTAENHSRNCLLYRHTPMDRFPSALGSQGVYSSRGRRKRQVRLRRPTAEHPEMASISGRQAQLQLTLRVPAPGQYALVLEYASEVDTVQNVNLLISGQAEAQARVNIYSCAYSFLCRGVAVDWSSRVAEFQLNHKTDLFLQTSTASFLLHKVYAVPIEDFCMEYVDPKVFCVHRRSSEDSRSCVPSQYELPSLALLLEAAREGRLSVPAPGRRSRQAAPQSLSAPPREGVLLKSPQTEINFHARAPAAGRYVFVVHFRQLEHLSFPVEVQVDGGRPWTGSVNAYFCPHVSGCRDVVVAERRIALGLPRQQFTITLRIPPGKTLTLDYILVVPDDSYRPEILKEKPLDKSSDFISQCGGNSFYINSSSSQFCRDSARSLVAFFNDGALPCNCDKIGATGPTCAPVGGQCPCRPNVIGRKCTRCATGYYGFPYCRPCECGKRLCDEVTGQCICPPQTVKPACDVCESQTFSYHPLLGCEGCDCSPNGVVNPAEGDCDQDTGQCSCKDRVGGRQCDRCTPGYYRFPKCVPCNCKQGGTVPEVCHPQTGVCLCKKNVEGAKCDSCRAGSFHFDAANPKGCTSCFCFGATTKCRSSDKRRAKFVDMQSWRLEKSNQEEVSSVYNPASNTVVADVQELPAAVQNLHWVAPPSYLGDRVSSYGGYLTYQVKSFGIPSEGMALLDRRPDIQLKGEQMTLVHQDPMAPSPDRLFHGRVQLLEGNFCHGGTNRPVSREELMMVLAGLEDLRIRGLYFAQSQRLSLGEVGLEQASPTGSGASASTVEVCECPPGHRGDSCQKCAPGHYRERKGLYLGHCVPCSCNGLSNECDEATGRCLNCKHNTAGDQCERCKEGYYGNAAERTCQVCPCPFNAESNSFATSCRQVAGGFECVCKQGYTGPRCGRCAPGYYGDPMAFKGSCLPCNCNGNPGGCDSRTGVCKNSLEPKDTTDEQCQDCDNCVQTLLNDLERLDAELSKLKSQLENVSASSAAKDRLKKLEDAITATKNLVKKYNTTVSSQIPKVKQLEEEALVLNDDIGVLKKKANNNSETAKKAIEEADKTHQRAKDLMSEIESLIKKINDLLKQLSNMTNTGGVVPNEELEKMLADAERMLKEMTDRSFSDPKKAAETEREEARKLLDYIKNNVTRQYDINKETADRLAGLLKQHEDKLKDLEEALKEADDTVKKANRQNGLNGQALKEILKRKEDLEKERKKVADQITMAKDQLKDTADLLRMLEDSKKEYEELAAQLDGAKTDLIKKVNNISLAASKEDIVNKAEEHARTLERLANELKEAVRNGSGSAEVRCAVDAIDAYKNITEAIKAAEEAAKEAKEAADKALRDVQGQDLTKRAKDLKDKGSALLDQATNAEKDLNAATDELDAQKKRLNKAEKKKEALKKDLKAAKDELDKINRDDIGDIIDMAKTTAAGANDTANEVMDRINTIKDEVDKIKVLPVDSNLDSLLNDVDNSVKNLSNAIPSLLDKIKDIDDLSSQIPPSNNVSENIKRIKELIELARDAANRITVPMKFLGDSYVELRTPSNLDDLRAYTSVSLSLQRPNSPSSDSGRGDGARARRQTPVDDGNLFVLYLGSTDTSKDYIGMVLRNNQLFCIYKLNGVEYEVETDFITKSESEPSYFDKVDLMRIYEDVKVNLTKFYTSNKPSPTVSYTNRGDPIRNLLSLKPEEVVFYVGGYPDDFTPPKLLNYPKYKGCIEMSTFNERFISLYNFKKVVNVGQTPCKRYVPSELFLYFEGSGYAKLPIERITSTLIFSQSVFTQSENAVLLYIGNEDTYYMVTVERGYVVLRGRQGDRMLETVRSATKEFPLEKEEDILIILSSSNNLVNVRIRGKNIVSFPYTPGQFKTYYLGGLPLSLRERHNITTPPLKGCVKNVKLGGSYPTFEEKVGISRGCPTNFLASRKAEFSLGSSLSTPSTDFSLTGDVSISLGFKSTEKNSLLLKNSQAGSGIELSLQNGLLLVKFNDKTWKSTKSYEDGEWHYLTVTKTGQSLQLWIDEEEEGRLNDLTPVSSDGGDIILGKDTFKGCLTNLYMRRALYQPEDLSKFTSSGDVLLDVCSAERPPLLMLANRNRTASAGSMTKEEARDDHTSSCRLPTPVKHSYRLGGSASYLSYSIAPDTLKNRPHFSLDVRTTSADGLLLYAASSRGSSHLALYMAKGRIRLSIGGKRHIFNREKYSDGKWHTVMFSWERRKFRLVVDGLRAHDGQLSPDEARSFSLQSPVYLGGVPASIHTEQQWKAVPRQGVIGCIRNFKMNGQPMTEPTANHGAAPCFDGPTEEGAYFSGNGGYAVIEESFVVGVSFELVFEVRPRNLTGVLFHIGGSHGHHLSLFLRKGEVVVQVNNGAGVFSVSVAPQQTLCDGMFHRVAVIKRNNVVQLDVDAEEQYKVGPSSAVSTRTRDPLYVGGIPETSQHTQPPVRTSFVGCLQNVRINGNVVSFDKVARVVGPVNLRECPAS
ncbi:laminin subunit alpha-3-like [Megalops cyprinoides]|uniref:laminin subunit alpha-3-like n=1 Tax=Megalops cyprinoides TaxID=118141 RepID=UPI00186465B2|nr:laminin subunit alpha-3-like [Megalops cyprinoides]